MSDTTTSSANSKFWQAWLPVIALSFAAFIFNTTEFVPVGLLPSIAESFNMDVSHTGLLITGYAWVVTLMSLPLTILTARIERRLLLVILFVLFIGSHIMAWLAWSFASLMVARIGIACAHAVFWAITVPLAARIAPFHKRAKALSFIVTGSSLATVLGVPIGTIIGQHTGWRITFLCIAIIAFIVMLILIWLLPKLPSNNAGSLKSLPSLLKRPALINVYILTAIIVTGHFTAYTYITPFMTEVGGFSKNFVVILLLCIGGAGIIGSIIFTKKSPQYPIGLVLSSIAILLTSLLVLTISTYSHYTTAILCIIWGSVMTIIALALQTKVLDIAPDASDVAISMFSGIFNIGIGGGALVGSIVLAKTNTSYVGYAGAVFVLIAFAIFCLISRRYWTQQYNLQPYQEKLAADK
ncbi:sugar transporter [Entomomonas sp. E2T0]|uniref:sugar transporter n=1 Tax=Entomomonas sp. E2T0 TaxID=2930213 RepID=UPI00222845A1|nr:sugar transporter [Entomomonas sp. E2T0]UYZ82554.1 sugar transporter [Entomomonas sp. E2T0]